MRQAIDDHNPAYLFQMANNALLKKVLLSKENLFTLASKELASRGVDINGAWVGFDQAETEHQKRIKK